MRLKFIYQSIIVLLTIIVFVACNKDKHESYVIDINKDIVCSDKDQTIDIEYRLDESVVGSIKNVTVTCSESWVSVVSTSQIGVVTLHVDQNNGSNRSSRITISAPGCHSATTTLTQYGTPPAVANHTLMFYFFGTSLSRYFKTNLEDAAIAIETGILGNNNRVVFFRQESTDKAYFGELCYDVSTKECTETRLEEVELDSKAIITPESIGRYIAKMAEIAPAKRYGIVFAGHGQGWITREIIANDKDISAFGLGHNPWIPADGAEVTRAFGESNVQVNIDELALGISHSNVELDYILFDACFMSNIEAIYDLRNSANYIIASPCEIMGKGFPYHRTLPHLFKDGGMTTDYKGAAESYYKFYRDEYTNSSRCGSITVYDCAEIEALANATRQVVRTATDEYDASKLQTYEGQSIHHFYDFGEWVEVVATDSSALNSFKEQMAKAVVATHSLSTFYSAYGSYGTYKINLDVYSGVTTSAPSKAYPNGWKMTNWYKDVIELDN